MASGSVRKMKERPGRKRAKPYRVSWREHPGAKQKTRYFATKAEADAFHTTTMSSLDSGTYLDPNNAKTLFRDYAETWRAAQVHAEGTEAAVEKDLRLHIYPILGDRPIGGILTSQVQGLVRRLGTEQAPQGKALASSTVRVVYGRVVSVFASAVADHMIAASPCKGITLPPVKPAHLLQVLSDDQVFALAEAVPDFYHHLIAAWAGLGLRSGEIFGLTVDRVDFLRHKVRIDQQLVRSRKEGGIILSPKLKTPTSYRTLPLAPSVAETIAARLERYGPGPQGLVFTNEFGRPIQQFPFSEMFEKARLKAKIPAWTWGDEVEPPTPHDLRHYCASVLVRSAGSSQASIKAVQQFLGHASAKVTLDTYGHLFPDDEDRTRNAIENIFSARKTA